MITIYIKVKPGSSRDEISIDEEGNWNIRIKERPVEGAANIYLVRFLAKQLGLAKSKIAIEKGQTSPFKKIVIEMEDAAFQRSIKEFRK